MTLQENIERIVSACRKIEGERVLTSKDVKHLLVYEREAMQVITDSKVKKTKKK